MAELKQNLFKFSTVQDLYDCLSALLKDPAFNAKQSYVFGPDEDQCLLFVVDEDTGDICFTE